MPLLPGHTVIGCKWVFKVKLNPGSSLERYKARLITKDFQQTLGLDYFETFSLVVKPTTIWIVLSLAITLQWPIKQLDVHNAFLRGDLSKTIVGFLSTSTPNYVCKLNKVLYSLKENPCAWYTKFSTYLLHCGFQGSKFDTSVFFSNQGSSILILLMYVDYIIITGNHSILVKSLIDQLHNQFALKDLGYFSYFSRHSS